MKRQPTLIDGVHEQVNEKKERAPDVLNCSVGGSGLLGGVFLGPKQLQDQDWKNASVLAVETDGTVRFHDYLKTKQFITLDEI